MEGTKRRGQRKNTKINGEATATRHATLRTRENISLTGRRLIYSIKHLADYTSSLHAAQRALMEELRYILDNNRILLENEYSSGYKFLKNIVFDKVPIVLNS